MAPVGSGPTGARPVIRIPKTQIPEKCDVIDGHPLGFRRENHRAQLVLQFGLAAIEKPHEPPVEGARAIIPTRFVSDMAARIAEIACRAVAFVPRMIGIQTGDGLNNRIINAANPSQQGLGAVAARGCEKTAEVCQGAPVVPLAERTQELQDDDSAVRRGCGSAHRL